MPENLPIVLIAIAVLLLLSAFFSGSETALTAASRSRIHHLARRGSRRARLVSRLMEDREHLIGAILIGNNTVNILASALATGLMIALVGNAGVAYATVGMTVLVLIFAEILPKTYAIHRADQVALMVAPVLRVVVLVLTPFVNAVRAIVRGALRALGVTGLEARGPEAAEEELRGVISLTAAEGAMVKRERDMLHGILDLAEVEVHEVMTHRKNIKMINADAPPAQIVEEVLHSPFTRHPLWRGEADNIVGVLHVKDLWRSVRAHGDHLEGFDVMQAATAPWFVPETTTLRDQLSQFLQRRAHFALVVDEYGALQGLVTLEDILEEIVGEIVDEHDVALRRVLAQPDGSYLVPGTATVRDLNRELDWRLPEEEAATAAGLVLQEAREIPEVGRRVEIAGYTFIVLRRQRHQVTLLRVVPPARRPESEGE